MPAIFWWMWTGCSAPAPVAAAPVSTREPQERHGRFRELPRLAAPCEGFGAAATYQYLEPFGGKETPTFVHVPATPGPHRMVVALHGGKGDAASILEQTGLLSLAVAEDFVLVVPSGAVSADGKNNWNPREPAPGPGVRPVGEGRDDVRYLDALVGSIGERTCARQVLGVGFSNGAMMAMRWLCQGEAIDAAVTAAGRLGVAPATCRAPRPIRSYIGTADDQYRLDHPTTPESLDLWARINGCRGDPTEQRAGRVTTRVWTGCAAPTVQYVIEGYPHAWPRPGAKGDAPMDATVDGWKWFLENVP